MWISRIKNTSNPKAKEETERANHHSYFDTSNIELHLIKTGYQRSKITEGIMHQREFRSKTTVSRTPFHTQI